MNNQFAMTVHANHETKKTTIQLWEHGKLIAEKPYDYELQRYIIEEFKGKGACEEYNNRPLHNVYS